MFSLVLMRALNSSRKNHFCYSYLFYIYIFTFTVIDEALQNSKIVHRVYHSRQMYHSTIDLQDIQLSEPPVIKEFSTDQTQEKEN